ncbi:MAG: carboxyl transferase domain-containing protein [Bacillota bacterium]|jgi:acetyl-CoA carboxylase carboxyltransferase component
MGLSKSDERLAELRRRREEVLAGGGPERVEKQHARGKLTARERLDLLFDPGSFVELQVFVSHRCREFGLDQEKIPGEGVVTGYGRVDGRTVYAFAQDFTVMGGALGEMHAAKICRVMDLALAGGCPFVGLNDSGGARIQEGVDALNGYGNIFYRNTLASGVIPQISAIMGPSAGGAVYSPGLTDFIFMVDGAAQMFITGPQVIKTVTGEEVTMEELGGAATHNRVSGVAHFFAADDRECLAQVRRLLSFLPSNNLEDPPVVETGDNPGRTDPALRTVIPDEANKPYDVREIILSILDGGDFMETQAWWAENMVTGFGRLAGRTVGVIANQARTLAGAIDINASDKAARFVRFCDAFNIPLLTLVDTPGYLPGTAQEYGGIIRHGAKMLYAYSEATVPKIQLILRKAYGGSYLAMCARSLGADMVFAWPAAEIAVMGAAGAVEVIFREEIKGAEDPGEARRRLIADYEARFSNPYAAAARGLVDSVIDPADTRPEIIRALSALTTKRETRPAKKHGNIPV